MRILEEAVERYLRDLRPTRSPVMREMEEHAERDSIPIVHWETGACWPCSAGFSTRSC
jgi:predicted O-methyltransferase YrrM